MSTSKAEQELYDRSWEAFLKTARDPTTKLCTVYGFGREFGERMRDLASHLLSTAVLKAAFQQGWQATKEIRDEQANRIAFLSINLASEQHSSRERMLIARREAEFWKSRCEKVIPPHPGENGDVRMNRRELEYTFAQMGKQDAVIADLREQVANLQEKINALRYTEAPHGKG